jgi:hypothetical protein
MLNYRMSAAYFCTPMIKADRLAASASLRVSGAVLELFFCHWRRTCKLRQPIVKQALAGA